MPKTIRNVFYPALTYENLMQAHLHSRKGKLNRTAVIKFNLKQEEYIMWLCEALRNKTYKHGGYKTFYVFEPKVRKVETSRYLDRVVHTWYVEQFLYKYFVPCFIRNSYACIKNRGMHQAALDVQKAMRICKKIYGEYYILKMDVSKFFASINKDILYEIVAKKVKDPDLLWLTKLIIYSKNDDGIPIGNFPSQIFANIYLNELDQYVKHQLHVRFYYRFMDDMVIMLKDKNELKIVLSKIIDFLASTLKLSLNSKTNIFKCKQGVNFCGYKINEYRIKLRDKGKKKLKKKVKFLTKQVKLGNMDAKEAKRFLTGHYGYIKYADVYNLTSKIFINQG